MKKEDIRYFEYSEFNKVEKIGEGGFDVVNKAVTNKKQVALKYLVKRKSPKFEEKAIENLAKQLKYLCTVSCHYNINSFLGISKDDIAYVVVLEYVNNGNLRDFLKENFDSLQWENKIRMALDITRGLKYLHSKNIIHKNLNSNNILVDDDKLLIADFGLPRPATSNSKGNTIGNIGQSNTDDTHEKHEDSSVTSNSNNFNDLEYQQLFEKCWDGDPGKRHDDIHEKHEDSLVISNGNNFNDLHKQSGQSDLYIGNKETSNSLCIESDFMSSKN
ncbi:unnamed protein product [Rhizophagus irregularis]|uniref:Protein kinase domain-containing protein n=1 Tax=Rhizophagus irregularis TaxID=588596 RepID=A0A915Z0Z7_9GLOM|nr:unnamed protein product [Rhizophagus irregularis]